MYRLEYLSSLGIKRFFRVREWCTLSKYDLTPITLSIPISYLNPRVKVDRKSSTNFQLSQLKADIGFWNNECRIFRLHRA